MNISVQGPGRHLLMAVQTRNLLLIVAMFCLAGNCLGVWIVVTETGDSLHDPGCATTAIGPCTLRDAITFANTNPGNDSIGFIISGAGVHVITLNSPLPGLDGFGGVTIEGYTQLGSSENTAVDSDNAVILIELRPAPFLNFAFDGLLVRSSNNVIRGLAIGGFGFGIRFTELADDNGIRGNFIGTDTTGLTGNPNVFGIYLGLNSGFNFIGGPHPADRNVISGNYEGVILYGSRQNRIDGNFIGLGADGLERIPWIYFQDPGIGLSDSPDTVIGGVFAGERNVISGNGVGISVSGQTPGTTILGNWVGLNGKGTGPVPNGGGVGFANVPNCHCVSVTVGGVAPGSRNIISGNGVGIGLNGYNETLVIEGNSIGTDPTGTIAVPNQNGIYGVFISAFEFGGPFTIRGNIISGNAADGVVLDGFVSGVQVLRNAIGTDVNGGPLGNGRNGITLLSNSRHNDVGGGAADGNTIAFNGGAGIFMGFDAADIGSANRILSNAIHSNGALGIDLFPSGVTANDAGDPDIGSNNLQNFPALTQAVRSASGDRLLIVGTQDSLPASGPNQIQFFLADSDSSGFGEGKTLLLDWPGNPAGSFSFATPAFTPPVPVGAADRITSTATTYDGTSEFSQTIPLVSNQAPIANAGPGQSVRPGPVTLDGSASSNPDGLPGPAAIPNGSFVWTQTGGPGVVLAGAPGPHPSFVASSPGVYTFSLVVSDGLDVSAPSTVTIVVAGAALTVPTIGPAGMALLVAALALAGTILAHRNP